ncbi:MAG: Bacterial regulatory protein gntR family [Nocardioidaceae bacterium]|nr:Bacterial regulatory protein gntR family [Nocardioidaceae bacterium]
MTAGRAEATANALLGLVLDGTFPPGSSLPSEAELAGRFAVSRLTVRGSAAASGAWPGLR